MCITRNTNIKKSIYLEQTNIQKKNLTFISYSKIHTFYLHIFIIIFMNEKSDFDHIYM